MDISDSTTQYTLAIATLAILAAYFLLQPTGLVQWLQKKNYQYEVTFSLYMLTPTEKFVFNSIAFLSLSMLALATIMYLPDHVMTISRRTYYYFAGDGSTSPRSAAENLYGTATRAAGWAQTAYQAAMNRTVAEVAQEVATEAAERVPLEVN
ncbi:hypothetical protein AC579_2258 [Pseudocercospora musae]|uniref:Uncharacterized protein n=1 Tax=Pseudocercospora musae TaxID=113226 RepID=A0A139IUW5_9PEZI|nr:hypothetical protein AC579_2258 [Pseudocercospora musae]